MFYIYFCVKSFKLITKHKQTLVTNIVAILNSCAPSFFVDVHKIIQSKCIKRNKTKKKVDWNERDI